MAGILDNKSRIMDVFVTELGRRQIAGTPGGGQLRVEYASFTDGETFYAADVVSGSDDATNRLFFEATNRKQDFITFETDDSGILLGFEEDPSMTILDGNIFLDKPPLGDFSKATYVTGSRFASVSENLMTASLDHFRDLRMIGSLDSGEPINRQFLLDRNKLNFVITNTRPWGFFTAQQRKASVSDLDPMFVDKRLSNVINFRFLPPLIVEFPLMKPDAVRVQSILSQMRTEKKWLATYFPLGMITPMTFAQLLEELNGDVTPPRPPSTPAPRFSLGSLYPAGPGAGLNPEGSGFMGGTGAARLNSPLQLIGGGEPTALQINSEALARVLENRISERAQAGGFGARPASTSQSILALLGSNAVSHSDQEVDWDFPPGPYYNRQSWFRTYSRMYLDKEAEVPYRENPMSYPFPDTLPNVPRETIYFKESSSTNNIVMQMFEINEDVNTFKKLDVIDFGEVTVTYDSNRPTKHVFFVGKIFFNELRIPSFVNLFTIILD